MQATNNYHSRRSDIHLLDEEEEENEMAKGALESQGTAETASRREQLVEISREHVEIQVL